MLSSVRTWVAVVVTVAGIGLVAACGDEDAATDGGDAGAALAVNVPTVECRTDQSPTGTDEPEVNVPPDEQSSDLVPVPELPDPTIPGNVSPPTTPPLEEGEEPIEGDPVDPFDPNSPTIPALGGFRVDPAELGCVDFAVHLEEYGRFRMRSWGDDGIYTTIQVFSPEGNQVGGWETGEPQNYEGHSWEEGGLPSAGTYVIRTIHRGGSHNSFVLIMYGDPPA